MVLYRSFSSTQTLLCQSSVIVGNNLDLRVVGLLSSIKKKKNYIKQKKYLKMFLVKLFTQTWAISISEAISITSTNLPP